MGRAKEIVVKVIPASIANPFVKKVHYSGKVVNNSQVHFGVFLDGELHGVMSYGPSIVKSHIVGIVEGTGWNEFIELNRMAFDDYLPRNSESRAISMSLKMLKKNAPQIKWVVSFADGTQCGDGTIYRAANFILTGITRNNMILELPDKTSLAAIILTAHPYSKEAQHAKQVCGLPADKKWPVSAYIQRGAKKKEGFMLRYVYFIDRKYRDRLTVPVIPFSDIDKYGAGMYKGERVEREIRHEKKTEGQDTKPGELCPQT